jgi:hypothetical protein
MSNTIESIQELFKRKSTWTKGAWATNGKKGDNACEFEREQIREDEDAVCFCLGGAVTKVYDNALAQGLAEAKIAGVIRALFPDRINLRKNKGIGNETTIVRFNDHESTTIEEIRQVVKVANV